MKKEKTQSILVALFVAFCFLTICSRSSFIYPFNNWDDSNSYFSMGKMMMNGGVIYRDLFDQKGPLLYFIYGLGYLLSHTSFTGVFVVEILFFGAFLTAIYHIARLYVSHKTALFVLPFVALAVLVSKSFYWGGCAEEFCLPLFAWGLYFSVKYFKEEYPGPISYKIVLLCGTFAGCIMLIKFNLLGMYFAWMAMIALCNLNRRNWKNALLGCLIFLAGMLLPLIPWIVYFAVHGALDDWYHAYVYCNIFLYSDLYYKEKPDIGTKIYDLSKIMYWLIRDNFVYFAPVILGFAGVLVSRKIRWYEKINIYAMFGFLFLGIYIGGTTLFYYSLPLSLFCVFGFVLIGTWLEKISRQVCMKELGKKCLPIGGVLGYVCLLCLAWNLSMNTEYAKQDKTDFWLFHFRDIVCQEENATLLNIGCLDAGLYTAADVLPTCRYFQSNAVHGFDEVVKEQLRYIEEGQTEFVLAREVYPEEIWQKYDLIAKQPYVIGDNEFTYYLFQRKK